MSFKEISILTLIFILVIVPLTSADVIEEIKEQVMELGCWLLKLLFYLSSAVAALFILLAGMKYLTSNSPEGRYEARNRVIFAVVGLSVIIIACPLVSYFIEGTKIAPLPEDCCPIVSFKGEEITPPTAPLTCAEKCQDDWGAITGICASSNEVILKTCYTENICDPAIYSGGFSIPDGNLCGTDEWCCCCN